MKKSTVKCLIIVQFICSSFFCFSQKYFGVKVGYSQGSLFETSKPKYSFDSNYKFSSGGFFSMNFQKNDSIVNTRAQLQYNIQKTNLEFELDAGNNSSYKNLDLTYQAIEFNVDFIFPLTQKKNINLIIGPSIQRIINTHSIGNGWNFGLVSQFDSIGQPVYVLTTKDWSKDEKFSKDLTKTNFGLNFGWNIVIPYKNKFDFIIENNYTLYILNYTKLSNVNRTSFFKGGISFGGRLRM